MVFARVTANDQLRSKYARMSTYVFASPTLPRAHPLCLPRSRLAVVVSRLFVPARSGDHSLATEGLLLKYNDVPSIVAGSVGRLSGRRRVDTAHAM